MEDFSEADFAAYLAAELLTEFELAAELAETSGAEIAAPPTATTATTSSRGCI